MIVVYYQLNADMVISIADCEGGWPTLFSSLLIQVDFVMIGVEQSSSLVVKNLQEEVTIGVG